MTRPSAKPAAIAPFDSERAEAAIRELLIAIGEDPDREGLLNTPARVARAYRESFEGLQQDPTEVLTTIFDEGHDEMVLVRDISFASFCEHHLLPFMGTASVGYIPNESGADHRPVEAGPAGRGLRPPAAGPGAAHHPDRRRAREEPEPPGRDRRRAGRAPVHVDPRGTQARAL